MRPDVERVVKELALSAKYFHNMPGAWREPNDGAGESFEVYNLREAIHDALTSGTGYYKVSLTDLVLAEYDAREERRERLLLVTPVSGFG